MINARIIADGVDPNVYHATGHEIERGKPEFVMSRSQLVEFNHCPIRWLKGYEGKGETAAMLQGSALDCLLLTPDDFEKRFVVCPETYPAEGKKGEPPTEKDWNWNANFCKDWRKQQGGRQILKHDEMEAVDQAWEVLNEDREIVSLVKESRTQVFVMADYQDKETGLTVPLKALLDIVPNLDTPCAKMLLDFKTTYSADLRVWTRTVYEKNYHVQAALFHDLYVAATGEDRPDFAHIVQENYAPFHVEKRLLTSEFVDLGRYRYLKALEKYCQCLATGQWPGYECDQHWQGWQFVQPEAFMVAN